ncbi:alpha-L-fucosidase [Bacteroides clarus]|jgi:alpha-L-fucosidase|uniref:alpha-L-fucosidase n=1 Tax=Bacteroides clarus TaxID=626929 RepID=UPI002665D70F|nr:alpha-L-fucosidase [Bacteroides clarus]
MKKRLLSLIAGASLSFTLFAQGNFATKDHGFVHGVSKNYEWPTDPEVLKKLDQWQDLKFGIMFHWGVYSVPGISESWALCSEDKFTARRKKILSGATYGDFKKWYWGLADSFNPTKFNPAEWAAIMKDAGFKYLIFTTKHHDGFCMFDSKYTDYSIAKGPYKDSKYSNVAYHVFDAFRQQDFMIGAYFSKPDWHCEYYWDPALSTPTRNPNYNIKKNPDTWAKFQQYTANQIDELMTDYGRIDILWLDGGWVKKANKQDIKLDEIVDNARKKQPGLIAVDRTVPGRNENYQTPELRIPKTQLNHPWESNITLTNTWGWNPRPKYKSVNWVINTLAEITAKGGCFALNVGPSGEGVIEKEVLVRLKKVGEWLKKNGTAIYATRITPNYNYGNVWFTANKDGQTLYAIYALPEGEKLPEYIEWEGNEPSGKMTLLQNGKGVKYTCKDGKVKIMLPQGLKNEALAFSFKVKK